MYYGVPALIAERGQLFKALSRETVLVREMTGKYSHKQRRGARTTSLEILAFQTDWRKP